MGYLQSVLQPGEAVVYECKISWTTYFPGAFVVLAGIVLFFAINGANQQVALVAGGLIFIIGLLVLAQAWFERWTTEIAITSRRIILKRGFIRRDTAEMHMDKVESVDVKQSLFGRLFDYGDVTVRGTGAGLETLHLIDAPVAFRNHVKTHDAAPPNPH